VDPIDFDPQLILGMVLSSSATQLDLENGCVTMQHEDFRAAFSCKAKYVISFTFTVCFQQSV
jgi:hypothetical protein